MKVFHVHLSLGDIVDCITANPVQRKNKMNRKESD